MSIPFRPLLAALVVAATAACGGSGPTDPDPTPQKSSLILDFTYVEVIEDCDGVEGDGDFHFAVSVYPLTGGPTDVVYQASPTLGPGGKSPLIGRRTYTVDASRNVTMMVWFSASEVDRNVFGTVYNDERLDEQWDVARHAYDADTGTWSNLGPRTITLGSAGCRVQLSWTARDA